MITFTQLACSVVTSLSLFIRFAVEDPITQNHKSEMTSVVICRERANQTGFTFGRLQKNIGGTHLT